VTDPTTEFFEALRTRGHDPRLRGARGTFRFELVEGKNIDRWLVSVHKGDVTVAHRGGAADCVLRVDRAVFDQLASGELNGVAATLRGEFHVEGDWRLLVLFQRLFPGRDPSAAKQKKRAGYARRAS
jgi:ubiquinone biosynthesis protein UbiJ